MSEIQNQVHGKFKVFAGELAPDQTLGELAAEVAAFAASGKVAAKSIGVEFLEKLGRVVVTLGYAEGGESYPIRLHCVPLGKVDVLGEDFGGMEAAMSAASAQQKNIICHELYVTGAGDFYMVFMTHEA